MTVRDQLASLIRTGVPYGVGLALVWLGRKYGVVLDDSASAGLTSGLATLVGTAYYVAVRAAESRWPKLGWLLGLALPPTYTAPAKL